MNRPTKPAGFFLQLIGGVILIYAICNIAWANYQNLILFAPIGLALMYFGRRPSS